MKYAYKIMATIVVLLFMFVLYQDIQYYKHVKNFNNLCKVGKLELSEFETGDLILFRYEYFKDGKLHEPVEFQYMIFTCMMNFPYTFSHVGIILRVNEIPYILHTANYERLAADGTLIANKIDVFHLYDYLNKYGGNVYHAKYKYNFPDRLLYNKAEEIEHIPFKFDILTVLNYWMSSNLNNRDSNSVSCSGFVTRIMDEVGLINLKNKKYSLYTPNSLFIEAIKTGKYDWPVILPNKYYDESYIP